MEPKTFTPGFRLIKELFEEFGTGSVTWNDKIQLLKPGKKPLKSKKVNELVYEIFTEIKDGIETKSGPEREQAIGKVFQILNELSKVDHSVRDELHRIVAMKEKKAQEDALLDLFTHANVIRLCGRMIQKMFTDEEMSTLTKEQMRERIMSKYHRIFSSDCAQVASQANTQFHSRIGKMIFMIFSQIAELIAVEMGMKPPSAEEDAPKSGNSGDDDPNNIRYIPMPK